MRTIENENRAEPRSLARVYLPETHIQGGYLKFQLIRIIIAKVRNLKRSGIR